MLNRLNGVLTLICTTIAGAALCFMALIAFVDSIGRMMNSPLLGANEFIQFALITFFFAALPIAVKDDQQIRIGLVVDLYSAGIARLERWLTGVGDVVALILLTYMMYDQAMRLLRFGTITTFLQIPVAPWVLSATVFAALALWFALLNLWNLRREAAPRPYSIPDKDT